MKEFCIIIFTFLYLAPASSARSIQTINSERAHEVAREQVIWKDRLCPFSTAALDFLQSIYGKNSYKGLSPEQVVYGWLLRPEVWKDEPMIRIQDDNLCHQLNIDGNNACLSDLFDDTLGYRLNHLGANLPEKMRPLVRESPAVIELDEKVGTIILLTQGRLIKPRPANMEPLPAWRIEMEILWNYHPLWCILPSVVIIILLIWGAKRIRHHDDLGIVRFR